MARHEDLPHLIALLDDDSPVVREAVTRELGAFGDDLAGLLDTIEPAPSPQQQQHLRGLLDRYLERRLREAWPHWLELEEPDRLEAAQSLIAAYQNGPACRTALGPQLDGLAESFVAKYGRRDAHVLYRYLFEDLGFSGARKDYHHPRHSNLVRAIESRSGLPISLACIFLLVGRRLGMDVRGLNWPEHFLVRAIVDRREYIFDPFNGGPGNDRESFLKMQGPSRDAAEAILDQPCDAAHIMARVLRNLARGYELEGHPAAAELMIELLEDLQRRTARR